LTKVTHTDSLFTRFLKMQACKILWWSHHARKSTSVYCTTNLYQSNALLPQRHCNVT